MTYNTYQSQSILQSFIKCYWVLEVPAEENPPKQRIVPDGCMEMIFILGDDIKRYTSESDFIIQPRAIVVGQITEPFVIQPTGYVHCFAVRFYPYGFANFIDTPLQELENRERHINQLFEENAAKALEQQIIHADSNERRIEIVETFFLNKLNEKTTIDHIVKSTIDTLFSSKGSTPIGKILQDDTSKRRQLERKFYKQVGLSPKQMGKVIRLQTALNLLINEKPESLTQIAYESEYYDQAHFIKDFKEFTGTIPKEFLSDEAMSLSTMFYIKD